MQQEPDLNSSWNLSLEKTDGYRARNKEQRAKFIEEMKKINVKKIICVDETGFDG
jgi:hypothetical protein